VITGGFQRHLNLRIHWDSPARAAVAGVARTRRVNRENELTNLIFTIGQKITNGQSGAAA
jgi:hypothetical protein